MTGQLVGGNITVLRSLIGTGYLPDWRDAIVLLEDIKEMPYSLERDMLQFYQAGLFDGVAGIVVGQLTDCGDDDPVFGALARITAFLQHYVHVPVLADVPVGHDPYTSHAVVLGASVTLDPVTGLLTVHPPANLAD